MNIKKNFESDEEYEKFKNSYDMYKNNSYGKMYMSSLLDFYEILYNEFTISKKSYVQFPNNIANCNNASMFMFNFTNVEKLNDFDKNIIIILN